MKKNEMIIGLVFALLATLMLFINVWQSFRYNEVVKTVINLEEEQRKLLEVNKRLTAGTAVLSSPGRVDEIARNNLGLIKAEPSDLIQIELPLKDR